MKKKSSPAWRWILTLVLVLILVGLVYYGYRNNPSVGLQVCLDNPLGYDGREIGVGTEATVVRRLTDGFIVKELGRTIRVEGNPQEASPGDFVRMRGVFHKEGYLELKQLYVAKQRRLKILISIVPVLFVLVLFFRTYRFDWRRLLFTEKD